MAARAEKDLSGGKKFHKNALLKGLPPRAGLKLAERWPSKSLGSSGYWRIPLMRLVLRYAARAMIMRGRAVAEVRRIPPGR